MKINPKIVIKRILILLNYYVRFITPYEIKVHKVIQIDPLNIYKGRKLVFNKLGYYSVEPMPQETEVLNYYQNSYWKIRSEVSPVNRRDLVHFRMILELLPQNFTNPITILNFGAGHGGVSHLFWAAGHKVINLDPSLVFSSRDSRWIDCNNFEAIADKSIDFVYGSHSLEHVSDLGLTFSQLIRVASLDSFHFWEVPNGKCEGNGPAENMVEPPHNYYFTVKFFSEMYSNIIINKTFHHRVLDEKLHHENFVASNDSLGAVIRFLGSNLVKIV